MCTLRVAIKNKGSTYKLKSLDYSRDGLINNEYDNAERQENEKDVGLGSYQVHSHR